MLSRSSGYHLLEYAFYRKFHLTFLFIAQIVFINNTEFPFALKVRVMRQAPLAMLSTLNSAIFVEIQIFDLASHVTPGWPSG